MELVGSGYVARSGMILGQEGLEFLRGRRWCNASQWRIRHVYTWTEKETINNLLDVICIKIPISIYMCIYIAKIQEYVFTMTWGCHEPAWISNYPNPAWYLARRVWNFLRGEDGAMRFNCEFPIFSVEQTRKPLTNYWTWRWRASAALALLWPRYIGNSIKNQKKKNIYNMYQKSRSLSSLWIEVAMSQPG